MLEAEKGNELIDRLNALGEISIKAGTENKIWYSKDGVRITYKYPPDGFAVKQFDVCEDGEVKSYGFVVQLAPEQNGGA